MPLNTKKSLISLFLLAVWLGSAVPCQAAWIWSPDIGKWVNPKKSARDTPEAQYAWATEFYNQKDWDRAVEEFEKIPEAFPNSRLAAEGVYYAGLCWEQKGDIAKAADSYQRLIDKYPYSDRIKDAIKREFDIAGQFASGSKVKVLGVPALPGQDKAVELYTHIVKNAPFGSYGDQAQFKIGELYKAQGEYEEAQKAFQAVVDEYPSSELVPKARFEIAQSSLLASKRAQYNEEYADRAIEEFKGFKENFPDDQQAIQADDSIRLLREKKAMTSYDVAAFYEKQGHRESAKVYYSEVVDKYPETPAAASARNKLAEIDKQTPGSPKKVFGLGMPKLPAVHMPKVQMPKVQMPKIQMPQVHMPTLPKIGGSAKNEEK